MLQKQTAMIMSSPHPLLILLVLSFFFSSSLATFKPKSAAVLDSFIQCLPAHANPSFPINGSAINLPTNNPSNFKSTLEAYIKNSRFLTPKTRKPLAIIAARHESHVQATVVCAKSTGLQIRIRSGGHDYDGLSYVSDVPFVILDMFYLRSIDINMATETAWVRAGATLGELYCKIGNTSNVHAFPAGVCPSLGVGGHITGGGYGPMMRKFGLSIDNVVNALIVNAEGKILDRKGMGEDLFWAIRGGGAASFGVILSWKINLVRIPPKVTVFTVPRILAEGATRIVHRWQQVASKLDKELFIRVEPSVVNGSNPGGGNRTVRVGFIGQFVGPKSALLALMNKKFPELGLRANDTIEMSWLESAKYWYFGPGASTSALLDRPRGASFFKRKSDFVKEVIPEEGVERVWELMLKAGDMWMQWNPYGGRMEEIPASKTAYPHRAGYLFKIQYSKDWIEEGETKHQMSLIREMHDGMTPYVSKNPREAFQNYRDVDIGSNLPTNQTDFGKALLYGTKLFTSNFQRLVRVKTKVDPDNFFKHDQSIPPLRLNHQRTSNIRSF